MALTDNLISYWKLDEASGNALDAHGSNELTDTNTVGSTTGKINNARDFEFDNSEQFTLADNASLSTGDIDFTIQAWVNAESLAGSNKNVCGKYAAGQEEWKLLYADGGSFIFEVANAAFVTSSLGAPSTATWYHLIAWHDSVNNQLGIAVNAGSADTAAYSGGITDGTSAFSIGNIGGGFAFWDGLIDEVGFWKRVLTSDERTSLYNAGAGLAYPFSSTTVRPRSLMLLGVGC